MIFTAMVRLAGGVLAVNTLGALALALDVLALALLAGLPQRGRPVSAWWLAFLFSLSLPVERVVQRTVGFGLQLLSAQGAGGLLSLFWEAEVEGAGIILAGQYVLVDLPCSGARGLMLLFILLAVLMAVVRPGLGRGLIAVLVTLAAALVGNVIRISILSVGMAFPQAVAGLDVMAQPWHDLIGLFALALSAWPLIIMTRRWGKSNLKRIESQSASMVLPQKNDGLILDLPAVIATQQGDIIPPIQARHLSRFALPAGLIFLLLALIIVNLPARPVDVSRSENSAPFVLPLWLDGHFREITPLSAQEERYFTRYGGMAAKGTYGPNGLLLVRTTSPLRHLHAPDECLRGLGFRVDYQGFDRGGAPTAVYKAVSPDGLAWRVRVTFKSSSGLMTASVTEAVWHWLGSTDTWTAVQRLTPWSASPDSVKVWDEAVWAAFENL